MVPFKRSSRDCKRVKFCISALGSCAHVRELHRFQQGPFLEQDMLDSDEWTMQNILTAIQKAKETHGGFLKRSTKRHKYEASISR
jgi:tRNA U55 pseudouridine synthase TruB